MFIRARNQWLDAYDFETAERLLEMVKADAKGKRFNMTREQKRLFVVELRRKAQQLRVAFQLFNEDGKVPGKFNKLVVRLGRYKDAIVVEKMVEETARQLLEILKQIDMDKSLKKFSAINKNLIQGNLFEQLDQLERWIYPSAPLRPGEIHTLAAKEYHEARKILRRFTYLLMMLQDLEPGLNLKSLIAQIDDAQSSMGSRHDDQVVMTFGDAEQYEKTVIRVKPKVARATDELLTAFGRPTSKASWVPSLDQATVQVPPSRQATVSVIPICRGLFN